MASRAKTAVTPDMAELFGEFVKFVQTNGATPEPTRKAPAEGRSTKAPKAAKTAGLKRSVSGVITCGQAWELLGADPTYTPSNPAAPARNAQLWALNSKGLLAVK